MRFDRRHGFDVANPSAVLLADRLAPHVSGKAKARLVRFLTEYLMTTLRSYCEFHPSRREELNPSRN